MASQLASLWNRGLGQLWNSLLLTSLLLMLISTSERTLFSCSPWRIALRNNRVKKTNLVMQRNFTTIFYHKSFEQRKNFKSRWTMNMSNKHLERFPEWFWPYDGPDFQPFIKFVVATLYSTHNKPTNMKINPCSVGQSSHKYCHCPLEAKTLGFH